MSAHANKLAGTVVDAVCPIIANLGALAEQATRGRIVSILAVIVVVRQLMPPLDPIGRACVAFLTAMDGSRNETQRRNTTTA